MTLIILVISVLVAAVGMIGRHEFCRHCRHNFHAVGLHWLVRPDTPPTHSIFVFLLEFILDIYSMCCPTVVRRAVHALVLDSDTLRSRMLGSRTSHHCLTCRRRRRPQRAAKAALHPRRAGRRMHATSAVLPKALRPAVVGCSHRGIPPCFVGCALLALLVS